MSMMSLVTIPRCEREHEDGDTLTGWEVESISLAQAGSSGTLSRVKLMMMIPIHDTRT